MGVQQVLNQHVHPICQHAQSNHCLMLGFIMNGLFLRFPMQSLILELKKSKSCLRQLHYALFREFLSCISGAQSQNGFVTEWGPRAVLLNAKMYYFNHLKRWATGVSCVLTCGREFRSGQVVSLSVTFSPFWKFYKINNISQQYWASLNESNPAWWILINIYIKGNIAASLKGLLWRLTRQDNYSQQQPNNWYLIELSDLLIIKIIDGSCLARVIKLMLRRLWPLRTRACN